ncbi:hypothetical protein RHAL1_03933 [Beijerinckiaceae bacterium RH AL1]|nr:lipocalin-like domain-containing protein [Beijerinckiaceae bacterium]VVB49624.1 hypothetical protein RHCH11_RHCH11_03857 [Beijerinckiaceae bacterium RH CH11]VVB49702.1 hypothetical protein RHAL8_03853 [Beijerinckiaceae bacterium RH AL8]VVC56997.1 hypothetical protein RHAL1_03933 [Beijerinckiaceae bacterium RH AL1]
MRLLLSAILLTLSASVALALGPDDVVGTWTLVSAVRKVVATGAESGLYGDHPNGTIMYGRDGRMIVLIVQDKRPKPAGVATMTDADRVALFKSMLAYSGTYAIEGDTITHSISASWNEVWTGTKVARDVKRDGDRLIYTTKPAPASTDGQVSVVTLVWQKVH